MSLQDKLYHSYHCKNLVSLLSEKAELLNRPGSQSNNPMIQWFDALKESLTNVSEDPLAVKTANSKVMLVPCLFELLRECFLTHRWQESLKILLHLADIPQGTSMTVWKAGLQLLYADPDKNENIISNLAGQMRLLSELNAKEVVLEYVFFLLLRGHIDDTKYLFQSIPKHRGQKKRSTDRTHYIDTLFQGYQGLVWYVEWRRARDTMEHMEKIMKDTDFNLSQWTSMNHDQVINSHAIKASNFFSSTFDQMGVWDIFITKHIELLEFLDRLDEARHTLEQYRDRNSENPNAHKYLYEFSMKHGMETEEKIKQLKAIAGCVPSDSLVLELVQMLWKVRDATAICYLFGVLDYGCWRTKLQPWEMMATLLQQICSESDVKVKTSLKNCWQVRASWWPSYHFQDHMDLEKESSSVKFYKAVSALFLLGCDNTYSNTMRKGFDTEENEQFAESMNLCPPMGIT
ncbi:hypothetical protein ScPMuIL_014368 [Solemya velum]